MTRPWQLPFVLVLAAGAVVGGPVTPDGHRSTGSAAFTSEIDHPFLPLRPGTRWVYEGTGEAGRQERRVVTVSSRTRRVNGIDCTVVGGTLIVDGHVAESGVEWYAQDRDGNVWYFGEEVTEHRPGETAGALRGWEAGVGGAAAGIVMKADPRPGDRYAQERDGVETEMAEVLSVRERAFGLLGFFDGVLLTREYSVSDADLERTYYAAGVGPILEIDVNDGGSTELVEMTRS